MSDSAQRLARTALQVLLGLAAGAPLLAHTAGLPDTLPGLGVVLAVAAAITRLMALPLVNALLPGWLRAAPPAATTISPAPLTPVAAPAPAPATLTPPTDGGSGGGA